ncbi:MAG: tol-pal system protein YbgF [Xanthomonadales bacterium]|nr:tol-pal system protein YbgF [Xanthomonadales bacterium]
MSVVRKGYSKMASLVLAILVSSILYSALAQEATPSVTADLVIRVQELQDEVRELRGQLEEAQRELENLKRRQRDQYLDLDQRISELRDAQPVGSLGPVSGRPGGSPTGASVTDSGGDLEAPPADVPEVRAPLEEDAQLVGLGEPEVVSRSAPDTAAGEKAAYDTAFQALKELRYADAAQLFQEFLGQYPQSEYADNAQYWLGESYYVTRNYDIALNAFQGLLDNYPDSPKVPDALLKIGYTHYELKEWDQARAALTRVEQDYPDTTLARLAASRLKSMRMEGHF